MQFFFISIINILTIIIHGINTQNVNQPFPNGSPVNNIQYQLQPQTIYKLSPEQQRFLPKFHKFLHRLHHDRQNVEYQTIPIQGYQSGYLVPSSASSIPSQASVYNGIPLSPYQFPTEQNSYANNNPNFGMQASFRLPNLSIRDRLSLLAKKLHRLHHVPENQQASVQQWYPFLPSAPVNPVNIPEQNLQNDAPQFNYPQVNPQYATISTNPQNNLQNEPTSLYNGIPLSPYQFPTEQNSYANNNPDFEMQANFRLPNLGIRDGLSRLAKKLHKLHDAPQNQQASVPQWYPIQSTAPVNPVNIPEQNLQNETPQFNYPQIHPQYPDISTNQQNSLQNEPAPSSPWNLNGVQPFREWNNEPYNQPLPFQYNPNSNSAGYLNYPNLPLKKECGSSSVDPNSISNNALPPLFPSSRRSTKEENEENSKVNGTLSDSDELNQDENNESVDKDEDSESADNPENGRRILLHKLLHKVHHGNDGEKSALLVPTANVIQNRVPFQVDIGSPVVQNIPAIIQNVPAVVQNPPAVIQPAIVQSAPAFTQNSPQFYQNGPPVFTQSSPQFYQNGPPTPVYQNSFQVPVDAFPGNNLGSYGGHSHQSHIPIRIEVTNNNMQKPLGPF